MSTQPPRNGSRDYEVPCLPPDAAEFDFSAAAPSPGVPAGGSAPAATWEPTEIDCAPAVAAGPAVALRLTAQVGPGADPEASTREFVELLHALNGLDRALGGRGLVLDASLSAAARDLLTVVLRPLDVRWSLDRFRQMATLLEGQETAVPGGPPPSPGDDGRLDEVIALYERGDATAAGSPRDCVRAWRDRRSWLAGLQVESLQRGAG